MAREDRRPSPEDVARRRAEREARLERRLAEELEANGDLEAPWAKYPMRADSIGWRMGAGESWKELWVAYLDGMPDDHARWDYLRRQPPAPHDWFRHLAWRLLPTDPEPDAPALEALRKRLVDDGVLGIDVGFGLWVRRCERDGGIPAPWSRRRDPFKTLRYGTRELGFWARWGEESTEDERSQWMASQPSPDEAWQPAAHAFASRGGGSTGEIAGDLVVELAATGTLAPPWTRGAPPDLAGRHGVLNFDADAPYAAKWGWWASDVHDDSDTWNRYLGAWPSPPSDWDAALGRALPWLHAAVLPR